MLQTLIIDAVLLHHLNFGAGSSGVWLWSYKCPSTFSKPDTSAKICSVPLMLLTGGPANPAGPGDPVSPLSPWKATMKSQCRRVKTASQVLSTAHRGRILAQPHINYPLWKSCMPLPILLDKCSYIKKTISLPTSNHNADKGKTDLKKNSKDPLLQKKSICLSQFSQYWCCCTITETRTGVPRVPGAPEGPAGPVSP